LLTPNEAAYKSGGLVPSKEKEYAPGLLCNNLTDCVDDGKIETEYKWRTHGKGVGVCPATLA